jgi:hypothetical protein
MNENAMMFWSQAIRPLPQHLHSEKVTVEQRRDMNITQWSSSAAVERLFTSSTAAMTHNSDHITDVNVTKTIVGHIRKQPRRSSTWSRRASSRATAPRPRQSPSRPSYDCHRSCMFRRASSLTTHKRQEAAEQQHRRINAKAKEKEKGRRSKRRDPGSMRPRYPSDSFNKERSASTATSASSCPRKSRLLLPPSPPRKRQERWESPWKRLQWQCPKEESTGSC